jgi:hypothetical protein
MQHDCRQQQVLVQQVLQPATASQHKHQVTHSMLTTACPPAVADLLRCLQTACVIVVAYACMDLRELALPGGFLLLLLSAAAQLPFFIYLCGYLEGDSKITLQVSNTAAGC